MDEIVFDRPNQDAALQQWRDVLLAERGATQEQLHAAVEEARVLRGDLYAQVVKNEIDGWVGA